MLRGVVLAAVIAALLVPTAAHAGKSKRDDKVVVDAPTTRVETSGKRRTRVTVDAPHTHVRVDTRRRKVRINVPYFNRTIRW